MKKLRYPLAGLVLLCILSIALAKDVEAIPGKEYPITPEAGPWLVCVATFRPVPPRAGGQPTPPGVLAQELALYLRRDLKIPAYVFDHGKEEREKQRAEFERIRELCPGGKVRITRVEEQFAVMVGGYKDDEAAHKAMVEIKKWKQPPDQFCDIAFVAKPGKQNNGYEMEQTFINPFSTAFVAHNPTVPRERPDSRAADPFLKSLNDGESLTLLNCKKPWTLAVKSFAGATAIQPQTSGSKFLDMIGLGGKNGEQLGAAGMQAHELAEFLRKSKIEAYVLHTRTNSVVTVGNFERIDDPQLISVQRMMTGVELKGLPPNYQLFAQPLPMEVPRP